MDEVTPSVPDEFHCQECGAANYINVPAEAFIAPSVPDSVKEVAEHILVCCAGDQDATSEQKINAIVLELERFGRAQYERGVAKHHHCKDSAQICVQTARREAFKEGIEKAAEVCDKNAAIHKEFDGTWQALAETYAAEIRALLPKEGAKG